jgi:PilZ domain-containing protein
LSRGGSVDWVSDSREKRKSNVSGAVGDDPRRKSRRVPGPFTGRRLGALTVDVHIHDLSIGGCLIQSFHEVAAGRRMDLEIDLPVEGAVRVAAESVNTRPDYGFAVKFVDVPDDTRQKLARVVERLLERAR